MCSRRDLNEMIRERGREGEGEKEKEEKRGKKKYSLSLSLARIYSEKERAKEMTNRVSSSSTFSSSVASVDLPPSAVSLICRRKSTRFRAHVDYPFPLSKNCYVAPPPL